MWGGCWGVVGWGGLLARVRQWAGGWVAGGRVDGVGGGWGRGDGGGASKMLVQNGALRGEANCDEHCTVVVAIRLRPIAATWACLLV